MQLRERDDSLAVLDDGLAAARRGEGRLVLVGGEAGIGKTALVRHFCSGIRGARVLVGACDALTTPRPLGPIVDITDHLPRGRSSGAWSRKAVDELFRDELADPAWTTVAVVEDAHWADEATLDLLRSVGRRIHDRRALLVVTFRSDELDPSHPLRSVAGDLASVPGVVRTDLAPLSRSAVADLAAEAGDGHLDVDGLYRATGGNPFYVTEVLAAGGTAVPASVRDAVLARTARLADGARSVVEAAAVAPTRIEVWLLQALAEATDDHIDACVAAGVLRTDEPGTLAFRHELARLAIAGTLSPSRSTSLHARAAACILDRYAEEADPARVAHHAEYAGDASLTRTHATLAAVRAAAVGSHREAASQYERALRHANDLPPDRLAELLEGYAHEVSLTDRADAMLAAASRAVRLRRAAGDVLRLGAALRLEASALWSAGRSVEAGKVGLDAVVTLEPLGPTEELADAYAFMATHAMLSREHQAALDWGAKAIALASRIYSASALVRSLNSVGSSKLVVGDATGRDDLRRSIDIATRAGLDHAVAVGWSNLGSGSGEIRDYGVAEEALREAIAFASANDLDTNRNYATAWLARVRFEVGDWDQAASLASVLTADMAPITRIVALTVLGRLAARRGDPGAAAALDEAWELSTLTQDLQRLWPTAAARAELAWLAGDTGSIPALVDAVFDQAIEHEHAWAIGELGLWRWRAGGGTPPHPRPAEPYALHVSGRLSDAAAAWRELGCPYEAADALSDSDHPDELRDALAVLDELGAVAAGARVRRRLRQLGQRGIPRGPRPASTAHPAGLTARQQEVLELVVLGLTDADIAERLHVSAKTVGHHVSAILTKLGVASRGEAAHRAREEGFVEVAGGAAPRPPAGAADAERPT